MITSKSKILFKLTGSIACFKACQVISKLVQMGHEVQVVASNSALKFVGTATLEGLSGRPVVTDLWQTGHAMDHIHLARWGDLIIVAPASANFINKIASGVGDDLLTTIFLAHDFKKPYLVAPAMNTTMYMHPATQRSLKQLTDYGVQILEAASGVLACGEVGYGRLLEPELILGEIYKAMGDTEIPTLPKSNLKVLVTAGGTEEPIDQVRVISNRSTGATGATIADTLIDFGADVTYVHGTKAQLPRHECRHLKFESFQDLSNLLETELLIGNYQAVIHAAAVSDFSVAGEIKGKISSETEDLTLHLKKNPKLVNQLRKFARNPELKVIAFKMTASSSEKDQSDAVKKLFSQSQPNLVIHNDLDEIDKASGKHIFHWCEPGIDFKETLQIESPDELSFKLAEYLAKENS